MAAFGITDFHKAWEASWSPDGTKIAWTIESDAGDSIAVIDLPSQTAAIAMSYKPPQIDTWLGYPPSADWSPSGDKLIYTAAGISVINLALGTVTDIDAPGDRYGVGVKFSPSGDWAAWLAKENRILTLLNLETLEDFQIELPANAQLVDWVANP